MSTLLQAITALSHWAFEIMSVNVPFLNVSFFVLSLTILCFVFFLRIMDILTHRNQGGGGMESNNNKIYRSEK